MCGLKDPERESNNYVQLQMFGSKPLTSNHWLFLFTAHLI